MYMLTPAFGKTSRSNETRSFIAVTTASSFASLNA